MQNLINILENFYKRRANLFIIINIPYNIKDVESRTSSINYNKNFTFRSNRARMYPNRSDMFPKSLTRHFFTRDSSPLSIHALEKP